MSSCPRASARRCLPFAAILLAALFLATAAQASPTTSALPAQNITTTSATLEGHGTCDPGYTCKAYFDWHQVQGTWYQTAQVNHPCSGSVSCSWTQAATISGLLPGTGYTYAICSQEGATKFTCYGPTGSPGMQAFTTQWLPPTNTSAPTNSGTAQEYDLLMEGHGSWTSSPTGYSYQWEDCDTSGVNCVPISGATAQTYILSNTDVGHTVVVQETASNSGGSGAPATSAPSAVVAPSTIMSSTGTVTFNGDFESGITPWKNGGGGAQCANYGTPSTAPRLRGNFLLASNPIGQGNFSGEFSLPADSNPSTYPLEACALVTASQPLVLGADKYYGMMLYVPVGWTIPAISTSNSWWGVGITAFHFQNIYGAPIGFELHSDHVTVAVETGACNNYSTSSAGCQYRSNADAPPGCPSSSTVTCLRGYYAIPPGGLVPGAWNEIIMHVHWAADSTGEFQTWYRTAGSSTWTQSSSMNGLPTVQWDTTKGCCSPGYTDQVEAYTGALRAPLSVWMDNIDVGDGFGAVAATLP